MTHQRDKLLRGFIDLRRVQRIRLRDTEHIIVGIMKNTLLHEHSNQLQHTITIHLCRFQQPHTFTANLLIRLIVISPLLSTVHYHLQRVLVLTALTTITGIVRNYILRPEDCLVMTHPYHRPDTELDTLLMISHSKARHQFIRLIRANLDVRIHTS